MAQNLGAKKGQFSGWRVRLRGVLSTIRVKLHTGKTSCQGEAWGCYLTSSKEEIECRNEITNNLMKSYADRFNLEEIRLI